MRFSITVRQVPAIRRAIAQIPEGDWTSIGYTLHGIAQVAETRYQGMRLVVRRTRLDEAQGELGPDWRHHAFGQRCWRTASRTRTLGCRSSAA